MKILLLVLVIQVFSQSCLSSTGTQVDWWLIFKLPADTSIPYSGFEYYYCDSQNDCSAMNLMNDDLRDYTSALQRTVSQISFTSTTTMNVVWNDQPSGKSTISDRAHSKGILSASTSGQGFIINHSTPQFPVFDDTQSYIIPGMPSSSSVNGQHFCVTMMTSQINVVAEQYIIAQTLTQKANEISTFESTYPNIFALRNNSRKIPAQNGASQVKSKNGMIINVISKNQNLVDDFYATVVAPTLKVGLVMETWGNGTGGLQEAACTNTYQTYSNIYRNHNGYKFKYTKDHSKFGISVQSAMPYVCMSDLNRMTTQNKRGGTSLCFCIPKYGMQQISHLSKDRHADIQLIFILLHQLNINPKIKIFIHINYRCLEDLFNNKIRINELESTILHYKNIFKLEVDLIHLTVCNVLIYQSHFILNQVINNK